MERHNIQVCLLHSAPIVSLLATYKNKYKKTKINIIKKQKYIKSKTAVLFEHFKYRTFFVLLQIGKLS